MLSCRAEKAAAEEDMVVFGEVNITFMHVHPTIISGADVNARHQPKSSALSAQH